MDIFVSLCLPWIIAALCALIIVIDVRRTRRARAYEESGFSTELSPEDAEFLTANKMQWRDGVS